VAQKLERIPLTTQFSDIEDIPMDVEEEIIAELKKSRYFAIQLDESTDQ